MFDLWKLQDFSPGEGVVRKVFTEQFETSDWIDITAPGDVHQALIDAGRIEDPFYDRNEDTCAWMEEREWWYRISFASNEQPLRQDERMLLVFQGLDTFVTIWLNGEELGRHENMFREAVFDVSQRLRSDRLNTLALCFHPPLQQIEKAPFESWGRNPERVMMRKAQFGYGWDWGPRLPTIGIWRPVELRRQRYATIRGTYEYAADMGYCDADKITSGPDSYLSVHSTNSLFPANRYFFSPIKELQRTPAQPEITITPHGEHELHVHLRAVTYTYFLHLNVPDERTHFTDNYFDLEAGESRTIILTNRSITLTPEMVSVAACLCVFT